MPLLFNFSIGKGGQGVPNFLKGRSHFVDGIIIAYFAEICVSKYLDKI